jgi:tetratricopeptide (TPR) repeat protein
MNLNGMLARKIFDHNKQKHPFFVEESYVIAWMYPYMEPHGLILKLNNEPLKELDPAVMAQDRKFWDGLSKELLADPRFLGNESARKAYSKMRSSIGGLYVYRHLTDEAEAVFKQALELYPASPEANFRLAQLYMDQGHSDKAIRVLERFQKRDPLNDKISAAIQQLRNAPHKAGASQ